MMYLSLFLMFFRIGLFGFGGGLAMLPLIFQSVQEFGVMSAEEFANLVALSQVTPGPVAVNAATYVGFNSAGFFGALASTLGVALPCFLLVLLAVHFLDKFKESKGLEAIFAGIRPATVGMITAAAVFMAETSLVNGKLFSLGFFHRLREIGLDYINILPCVIFVITIILAGKFKINPIVIMIAMGVAGAFLCG